LETKTKKLRLIFAVLGIVTITIGFFVLKNLLSSKENNEPDNFVDLEEIYQKDLVVEDAELKTKLEKDVLYYKLILRNKYFEEFKIPEDSIYKYHNLTINLIDKDNFTIQKINIVESKLVHDKQRNELFYDGDLIMKSDKYKSIEGMVIIYNDAIE
jgi:hypothetical protein